jgi:hypothetical protein
MRRFSLFNRAGGLFRAFPLRDGAGCCAGAPNTLLTTNDPRHPPLPSARDSSSLLLSCATWGAALEASGAAAPLFFPSVR